MNGDDWLAYCKDAFPKIGRPNAESVVRKWAYRSRREIPEDLRDLSMDQLAEMAGRCRTAWVAAGGKARR